MSICKVSFTQAGHEADKVSHCKYVVSSLNSEADRLCPESFRVNSPDETRLLAVADNFQHQYSHLYPDRKLLLLCPANECGVKVTFQHPLSGVYNVIIHLVSLCNTCVSFSHIQKFVSTSLRPSAPEHPELYTWQGCASFVADFLSLELLEPPVDLVRQAHCVYVHTRTHTQ